MSDVVLVLGQVTFSDFEIPERVCFGGKQRLAVYHLPGGQRVIDALGRDDAEISWSGAFAGENATSRARLLDLLRAQGSVLPLSWDAFFYSVVISSFDAQYRKAWWIPYRICCTVVQDITGLSAIPAPSVSLQVSSDIGVAASLAGDGGVDLTIAQTAVGVPNASSPGTAAYVTAQTDLDQAQAQIDRSIGSVDLQLRAFTLALPPAASPAAAGVAALTAATAALGQISYLTAASGYVGRSVTNLGAAQN